MPRARRKTATDILMNQGVRSGAFFMPRGGGSRIYPAGDHASHTPNDGGKGAGMPNQNAAGDTGAANTTPNDGGVLRT